MKTTLFGNVKKASYDIVVKERDSARQRLGNVRDELAGCENSLNELRSELRKANSTIQRLEGSAKAKLYALIYETSREKWGIEVHDNPSSLQTLSLIHI